MKEEFCVHENAVLQDIRIVNPLYLRNRVLETAHKGHPGIVAMKNQLRSKLWWEGIDRDTLNMPRLSIGARNCQRNIITWECVSR